MSKASNQFHLRCEAAGIAQERCGPKARDLLLDLRKQPLRAQVSSYGGVKMPRHASLGVALKARLVRYLPAERAYVITPAGETWLTELETHGLIDLGRAGV